jgi:hypothetical protein
MRPTLIAARLALAFATPAAAQAPERMTPEQRTAIETACRADVAALCPGIEPGGGRIALCLRDNRERVGPTCRDALAKARAAR